MYVCIYEYTYECIQIYVYITDACILLLDLLLFPFQTLSFGLDVHMLPVRNVQSMESAVHVVTLVMFHCL